MPPPPVAAAKAPESWWAQTGPSHKCLICLIASLLSHNRPLRSLKYFLPLFIVAAIKKKKSAGEGGGSGKRSVEWAGDRGPGGEGRGTLAGLSPSPMPSPP